MASMACLEGNKRFFFIHVQKTAGKSITRALEEVNPVNSAKTMHDTARSFKKWWPREWRLYPSFAIVRNPYSRWVSIYVHYHPEYETFSKFLNDYKKWGDGWWLCNQWWILSDSKNGDPVVKHIFRFEDLEGSWESICKILGVEYKKLPLVGTMHRDRPPWQEFYDPQTIRLATDLSARDLDTFKYKFE